MRNLAELRADLGSSRGDSAGLIAAGLAAAIAWLWFPYRALIIGGAAIGVLGVWEFAGSLRAGRARHEQDILIRQLWAAARMLPSGYVLTDPDTGELLTVERDRGSLTLAVTDPPVPGTVAVVTRYALGKWAAPNPPPLHRHQGPAGDIPPARWRWQQRAVLEHLSRQSHALEVTAQELAGLIAQIGRSGALA